MVSSQYGRVSYLDRLHLVSIVLLAAFWATLRLIANVLTQRPPTLRRQVSDALYTLARQMNVNSTMAQTQSLLPRTADAYKTWAAKNANPVRIDALPDNNSSLLWIGPQDARTIILYFHGGAFFAPALDHNFAYFHAIQQHLRGQGLDVSVVALAYTLIPDAGVKSQLAQARDAVDHLISSGYKPQNIFLAGDSAGGSLCLALASHILHPLSGIPPLRLSSPLAGMILISPWARVRHLPPHSQFDNVDVVTMGTLRRWGLIAEELAQLAEDEAGYLDPLDAPEGWFQRMSTSVTRKVFVTAGGKEVLRDDILELSSLLGRQPGLDNVLVVDEDGIHDESTMRPSMGGFGPDFLVQDPITSALIRWLTDCHLE